MVGRLGTVVRRRAVVFVSALTWVAAGVVGVLTVAAVVARGFFGD